MTTAPQTSITLDSLGSLTEQDWQRITAVSREIATQIARAVVDQSLRGVADAIARGVYEAVIGQLDVETSTVIRDENGIITGASKVIKRAA